jgi:adenosylcobinamide-GDP ribazoletransferase
VAGTVRPAVAAVITLTVVAAASIAGVGFTLPLAVVTGLAAAFVLQRHAARRLGGITGDVLGALIETAATVTLVVVAMGPPA